MLEDIIINYREIWEIIIFSIIFVIAVIHFLCARMLKLWQDKAKTTDLIWDDLLIATVKKPVGIAIWVFGISYAAKLITLVTDVQWLSTINTVQELVLVLFVIWILVRFVGQLRTRLSNKQYMKKPMDQTTAQIVCKLIQFSVAITGTLIILQTLGYSVSGILAFGGVGGIAIGFAARDLLANFFGALIVYIDKPFKIGDWIRSPDKEIEGVVEDIGWRSTKIRTFDMRILYVPNAVFNQVSVENPSRMSNRRIYETIGLRYQDIDKMSVIVEQVQAYLESNDNIDKNRTLIVNFNQFSSSSIDFFIYTFTKTINWERYHQIKHQVLLDIANIIANNNAEIAFPTRSIQLTTESS